MIKCPNCKNQLIVLIGNDDKPAIMSITRNEMTKTFNFYECMKCGFCPLFKEKENLKWYVIYVTN